MEGASFPTGARSKVRRHPERGSHERELVHTILDEGLVCHVGVVVDGRPVVIPMAYGRDGDRLYLHGATGSRLLGALAEGCDVCVTVTLLDGLVAARSAFDSSMNYRSVVAFGRARRVADDAARRHALDVLTDHLLPGRTRELRAPLEREVNATEVIEVLIEEASAKSRSGAPSEPAPAPGAPEVWAGVVPLRLAAGEPLPAADLAPGTDLPASVLAILGRRGA